VEIAVFALALAAWRFPDENGDPLGVRADMPAPQVACCGLKVAAKPEDWMALVPDDAANAAYLRQELRLLHTSFAQAPLLGSLLDPARSLKNDLATSSFDTLRDLLGRALSTERPAVLWGQAGELQDDSWDLALTAHGLLEAARLLGGAFHLVVTNVPYLARRKQSDELKAYCGHRYPSAKGDLANVFLERCLELADSAQSGQALLVMPQNWLFAAHYLNQRRNLLETCGISFLAQLGAGAFDSISGEVVQAILIGASRGVGRQSISFLDASSAANVLQKADSLQRGEITSITPGAIRRDPDLRFLPTQDSSFPLLAEYADYSKGICTGDDPQYSRAFWEVGLLSNAPGWFPIQGAVKTSDTFGGLESVLLWEAGEGRLHRYVSERLGGSTGAWIRGQSVWGKEAF
jgi:hypothetical protein